MEGTSGTNQNTRNHSERIAGGYLSTTCTNMRLNWLVAFIRKFSVIYRKAVIVLVRTQHSDVFALILCCLSVRIIVFIMNTFGSVFRKLFVMEWRLIVT
jgi:hypothetical protein